MRKLILIGVLLLLRVVPVSAQDISHVRVAHFAVGYEAVDVYANDALLVAQLEFATLSEWLEVPAGAYALAMVAAGAALEDAIYTLGDFGLEAGAWTTLVVLGVADDPDFPIMVQPIREDYSLVGQGEARVTFFHAIPDVGAVDIYVANGPQLVGGLTYPGQAAQLGISREPAANDGYAILPDLLVGFYDLEVTDGDDPNNVLLRVNGIELASGRSYLIGLVGTGGDAQAVVTVTDVDTLLAAASRETSLDLQTETCQGEGTVQVRAAHFALLRDASALVDVYLNDELAVAGIDYSEVGEWSEIPAGNYDVALVPAGGELDAALVSATGAPLCADRWVTLAAIGLQSNNTLGIQPISEDFRPVEDGTARLTIFQGIVGAPPVNVQLAGGTLIVGGLTYPGQAAALGISNEVAANDGYATRTVDAGRYSIQVVRQDNNQVLLTFTALALENRHYYTLAAIGSTVRSGYVLVDNGELR
ncbi:MAG: DUF4397 domain-containing protein [Chloroflexi bacterium]|nr:DUF4397 domain-containing protein [Chloroflexota bacterium]